MNHDLSNRSSKRTRGAGALSILLVGVVVLIAIAFALAPSLFPIGDPRSWESQKLAASVIFTGGYFALAIGRIPGLNIAGSPWWPGQW